VSFYSNRLGLNIVKTLQETQSAKKPDKRPVFNQMLKDIRAGKYHGIVAWHPDRLARNMREGGEIIDMIDEGFITDLKFVTHHFTPDANGKMLLGMAFVLSKQYSDDLSQKVSRGMRRGFADGKSSGSPKPGYIRNEDGFYEPDGKNFELVSEAFQLRLTGTGHREIAEHMNNEGYGRRSKVTRPNEPVKLSRWTLGDYLLSLVIRFTTVYFCKLANHRYAQCAWLQLYASRK
jgi:site-specific DNA recombinase